MVARATESSIIEMLAARDVLSAAQLEAALKFRLDYQRAALAKPLTGSYNPASSHPSLYAIEEKRVC